MAWTSPYNSLLKSIDSPLDSPISSFEASTLGGLLPIGALFGAFIMGKIADNIGRFWTLILNVIPQIVSKIIIETLNYFKEKFFLKIWWLIVISSKDLTVLFVGRFLAGIAVGGSYTLVPLYTAEISDDKIRGSLNSFFILTMNVGMLMIYIAGEFLDYYVTHVIFLGISLLFLASFSYFPETPVYLIKIGQIEKAKESMKFFGHELKASEIENLNVKNFQNIPLKVPIALKPIFYGAVMVTFHQISGFLALVVYASDIFRESGSSLSPNRSAVIVGIILSFGSTLSVFIIDRFKRKSLFSTVVIGNIIGLLMMGFYEFLKHSYELDGWKFIPLISFAIVIISSAAGRIPLCYLIAAEIQPKSHRSLGIGICSAVNWLAAFVVLQFFASFIEAFSFHNCMFIFAIVSVIHLFFVHAVIPETKSKSFEEIEIAMKSKEKINFLPINETK